MQPDWKTKPWGELNPWEKRQRVQYESERRGAPQDNMSIAARLGVHYTTVAYWLDPEKRQQKQRYARERYRDTPFEERREWNRVNYIVQKHNGTHWKPRSEVSKRRRRERERSPEFKAKRNAKQRAQRAEARNPAGYSVAHAQHAVAGTAAVGCAHLDQA